MVKWRYRPHVRQKITDNIRAISHGPQEFLEIHRLHLEFRLVANTVALYTLVIYPQHGAAANHIELTVYAERLERCRNFRIVLNLVEKNKSFPRYELLFGINARDISDDILYGVAIFADGLVLFLQHKVYVDKILVIYREMLDGFRLPYLTGPFDNQGFPIGGFFPF